MAKTLKQVLKVNMLTTNQKLAVMTLWNNEYPVQLKYSNLDELEAYLEPLLNPSHYLLHTENQNIKGWALAFDREGERWFAIIVNSPEQRKGYGSQLLEALKADNDRLSGWVIDHNNYLKNDGTSYISPLPFYLKSSFRLVSNQRIENDKLSAVKISLGQS